jgi:hypothetical protein
MWLQVLGARLCSMSESRASKIAWRRGARGATYVGTLSRGADTIRLKGRDSVLGIEVVLSIPVDEIASVGVTEPVGASGDDEPAVVLDLLASEPIHLRPIGAAPLHVHSLARALGAAIAASTVLAQGGRS